MKKTYDGIIIIQLLKLVEDTADIPINSYLDNGYIEIKEVKYC